MVSNFRSWARRQGAPTTVAIMVSLGVAALINWFTMNQLFPFLAFSGIGKIWTLITYPWAFMPLGSAGTLIFLVFSMYWFLMVGSTVENDLGQKRYWEFLATMTLIPAIICALAAPSFGIHLLLAGPTFPLSALTVAWATRHPEMPVSLFGCIPLAAKWLGWIAAFGIFFSYGFGSPVFGVIATLYLGLAYLYASGKLPGLTYGRPVYKATQSKSQKLREEAYYDDVIRRENERAERERLRKLFESSISDDK